MEKMVLTLLAIGNLGTLFGYLNIFVFSQFESKVIYNFFRGTGIGGAFIGYLILAGIAGTLFFFIYLSKKEKNRALLFANVCLMLLFFAMMFKVAPHM